MRAAGTWTLAQWLRYWLTTRTNRCGNPIAAATLHRIRATVRAALNAAVREGLLTDNPARRLELPPARRPHPVVWTHAAGRSVERDGTREPVAVWTVDQLVVFLSRAERDRLHALWHLIALRGLRRGEAAGQRWCDLDLTGRVLPITQQRTEIPGRPTQRPGAGFAGPRAAPASIATAEAETLAALQTASGVVVALAVGR